ncbi:MAG: hypothetical protein B7Y62_06520 [Sphingomonadales bacterium 35-56-22]|nr:MAG: hypothetical protein B7Y62_06520 [Sphingomonadales bacterium 35-56-22]OYY98817.1 MAG: hypothetical protein B7Y38_02580 [Sphingomonadales bacterium 28-56-43]OYZ60985.1 MAG: hypothetical protein B7Y10_04860 [Sphingomonadales bacterium 24-56-14]OZA84183.1 MAG: hypothetical protein B7X66_01605 [Sphingomonadales bacterium 39-57-19]
MRGSFVETTLAPGETVKYQARVSVWSLWFLILLGVATMWFVVGFVFFLIAFLRWWSTELAITDKKVVAKYGLISRQTVEILLPRVESIQVQQGFIGRICNFGTLVMSGTGTAQAPIVGISNPLMFRRVLLSVQEESKS